MLIAYFLQFPIEYKAALDKLMSSPGWILLSDLELAPSEAVQFAISLWAEGLLEPNQTE